MGSSGSKSLLEDVEDIFTKDEIRRLTKRFDKLDTDGSGGISMEELMKLPELKGNPLAKRVYTVMDKNGDGNVDFSEFIVTFTSFLASKSPQTEEAIIIETVGTEKKPGDVSPASSPSKTPLSSIKEESSEAIDGVSSNGTCQVKVKVTSHDDKKPALGENQQVSPDMEKRLRMAFNIYDVDGDGKISRDDLFNALKLMVGGGLKEKSLMEAVNRTWIRMAQKGEEDLMDFKEFCDMLQGRNVVKKLFEKMHINTI